jgi:hypothetical protein
MRSQETCLIAVADSLFYRDADTQTIDCYGDASTFEIAKDYLDLTYPEACYLFVDSIHFNKNAQKVADMLRGMADRGKVLPDSVVESLGRWG